MNKKYTFLSDDFAQNLGNLFKNVSSYIPLKKIEEIHTFINKRYEV